MNEKATTIYTDGACSGNPGPGGWGAVIITDGGEQELFGSEPETTTNNRMGLMAAIRALEFLKGTSEVILYSDSKYLIDGITKWLSNWKTRNWKTASGDPVKNKDLWQRLAAVKEKHHVTFRWVKGHSGVPGNERADTLANLPLVALS